MFLLENIQSSFPSSLSSSSSSSSSPQQQSNHPPHHAPSSDNENEDEDYFENFRKASPAIHEGLDANASSSSPSDDASTDDCRSLNQYLLLHTLTDMTACKQTLALKHRDAASNPDACCFSLISPNVELNLERGVWNKEIHGGEPLYIN